ncbi:GNAT family N-acetyltransferase [Nocardioides anomalus]|uniref:GNAT family N-acetyltransferase n=1 Tax=Nocardioides anomalus TaxID=2712223 RepID=A0A6G6WAD7_9ACTN|nr:GNAT family N-acetyltransferase [Nocardioides anomalus]QIG42311.1 GNAT family N-acetyltransferase [Nocardioides anomalus]
MDERTQQRVDAWWRALFEVGDELWSAVTVRHPHSALLGDYEGWYVAWRDAGVHVSAPTSAAADEIASLRDEPALALQDAAFWAAFAHQRGLDVIGPGVHRYLDVDPGVGHGVREASPHELRRLLARVPEADAWESGLDDRLDEPGVVAFGADGADGELVGGAVLGELDGAPRNVTLLVAPDARGRGLGTGLGRAAASYAVRHHGYARWRSRDTNVPSSRAAERLGFEPYCTQLAIRRGSSGA